MLGEPDASRSGNSPLLSFTVCVRSLDRASASGGAQAGGEGGAVCVQALRAAALPLLPITACVRSLLVWDASVGGGCAGGVAVAVLFAL